MRTAYNIPAQTARRATGKPGGDRLPLRGGLCAEPGHFSLVPIAPFGLDLTVWALRRRPQNLVDRWDGTTYLRSQIQSMCFYLS